jgi:hypothetical protein
MRKRAGMNTNFGELTREEAVKQFNPSLLDAPGIPEIKRCELYNKYRPLVPNKTELPIVKRLMLRSRGSVMMLHITIIELGPPKSGLAMISDN